MASRVLVHQFPALNDNYGYLVYDEASGACAAVDTPDAAAVQAACAAKGWKLTHILCTHHHGDHVGGNAALKAGDPSVTVVGPAADAARIPCLDVAAAGGQQLSLGSASYTCLDVPGHTRGHCAYHFPAARAAFVGDTLFSLGCGRMFEGTPAQFAASLALLATLPDDTLLYCAHEYTAANARFALALEPGNAALQARAAEVSALRREGKPTVPSTLAQEKACNPFLRPHSQELRASLGLGAGASEVEVFAATRKAKDTF